MKVLIADDEVNEAEHGMAEELASNAVKELSAALKNKNVTVSSVVVTGVSKQALVAHAEEFGAGFEEKPHCSRCDSQGRPMIKFKSPNGETHYLCASCVALEDKREMKFSPLWRRSRRPPRVH